MLPNNAFQPAVLPFFMQNFSRYHEADQFPFMKYLGNPMRYIISVLLAVVLSACGTTSSIKLAIQKPDKTTFILSDERQPEQKLSRTENSYSGTTTIYGDDKLTPAVTDILCATLQERLGSQLEGKTISLAKFYVRVFEPAVSVDPNNLHNASASVPNGYVVEPLAGLLVLGIEKIKSEKIVSIDIEGALDKAPFATSVSDRYRGRVTEENMRTSLEHSLEQLSAELQLIGSGTVKGSSVAVANEEGSVDQKSDFGKIGEGGCSEVSPKVSTEIYFHRGKDLMALNDYKAAMVCFLRVQDEEKDTYAYRESCTQIATMYELGWGVNKDSEMARVWLKKAGL